MYSLKTLCADTIKKRNITYTKEKINCDSFEFLETFPIDFQLPKEQKEFLPIDKCLSVCIRNNPFISSISTNLHRAVFSNCFELVKEIISNKNDSLELTDYISVLNLCYNLANEEEYHKNKYKKYKIIEIQQLLLEKYISTNPNSTFDFIHLPILNRRTFRLKLM